MKSIRLAMASAFVLAIGSAFVTTTAASPKSIGFVQTGTSCTPVSTTCKLTGAFICGTTIYQSQDPLNSSKCKTLLPKRDN